MAQRGRQRLLVIVARLSREGDEVQAWSAESDQRPEWQRPGEVWAGFPEAVARYCTPYSQTHEESWVTSYLVID